MPHHLPRGFSFETMGITHPAPRWYGYYRLYLPLARFTDGATWPAVALALGAALTEFCGVLGPTIGAPRRYDGPMGKSDRAFVVGALALATWFAPGLARFWPWILGAAAALTAVTCWNRLRRALA